MHVMSVRLSGAVVWLEHAACIPEGLAYLVHSLPVAVNDQHKEECKAHRHVQHCHMILSNALVGVSSRARRCCQSLLCRRNKMLFMHMEVVSHWPHLCCVDCCSDGCKAGALRPQGCLCLVTQRPAKSLQAMQFCNRSCL